MELSDLIGLSLQMYGLAIVISLIVALVIKGIVAVLSIAPKHAPSAPAPEASTSTPVADTKRTEDDIAAITAAIYAVMGAHRIVHIENARRSHAWETEGRLMHQTSHLPRRH
ncbi:MAG: hypothetical protein R3F54_14070 [Alphaproteobacteria bacterium]